MPTGITLCTYELSHVVHMNVHPNLQESNNRSIRATYSRHNFQHTFAKPRWSIFSTIVDGIALSREFDRKFVARPIGVHFM